MGTTIAESYRVIDKHVLIMNDLILSCLAEINAAQNSVQVLYKLSIEL